MGAALLSKATFLGFLCPCQPSEKESSWLLCVHHNVGYNVILFPYAAGSVRECYLLVITES